MIIHCPKCNSTNVVKNGKNRAGSQQFLCRNCKKSSVMYPHNRRTEFDKEQILAAYHERPTPSAVRGIARRFHIGRGTLKEMLKKSPRSGNGSTEFDASPG